MILLLCMMTMILIPWLLGKGSLLILYGKQKEKDFFFGDSLLTGFIICIGLAEATHLCAVLLRRSFSDCIKWYQIAMAGCVLLMLFVVLWNYIGNKKKENRKTPVFTSFTFKERICFFLLLLNVLAQSIYLTSGFRIYLGGDLTLETVVSFLQTNAIYQCNPLTGDPYLSGLPFRLQILCLPSFYGILSSMFHVPADFMVWVLVPLLVLIMTYAVYDIFSRIFFPGKQFEKIVFLLLVSFLIWISDSSFGLDGFGLLHGGFRGVTIRGAVIVPYVISLILRKKWRSLPLCYLAEAFMVWTLYGLGVGILVTVGMLVVEKAHEKIFGMKEKKDAGEGCT